jgi:hypothetical protein
MHMPRAPFLAAALLALFTAASPVYADFPAAPVEAGTVELTGWLHVDDLSFDLTTVEADVNGMVLFAPVSRTGRFSLTLPVNAQAVLRFEHPGHLPKEVKVDTHFAGDGAVGQHARHLTFAVVLERERHMAGLDYAGPVGTIAFEKGGGCAAITKDRKLVPSRRQKPIVF